MNRGSRYRQRQKFHFHRFSALGAQRRPSQCQTSPFIASPGTSSTCRLDAALEFAGVVVTTAKHSVRLEHLGRLVESFCRRLALFRIGEISVAGYHQKVVTENLMKLSRALQFVAVITSINFY